MKQKSSLFRNFYGIFYAGAILVWLQVRRAGGTISTTSCYTFCEDLFDDGVFGIDFTPVWRFCGLRLVRGKGSVPEDAAIIEN